MSYASSEALQKLWERYTKERSTEIRNLLVTAYIPLVKKVARGIGCTMRRFVLLEDLEASGMFGLIDAVEGFELSHGTKFETYARSRIWGSIIDGLRQYDWVSRAVRVKANTYRRARNALIAQLGRDPTHAEIAVHLSITEDAVLDLESSVVLDKRRIFLESEMRGEAKEDGDEGSILDIIPASPSEDFSSGEEDLFRFLTDGLEETNRLIIELYYRGGITCADISSLLNLTESRIFQRLNAALDCIRERLSAMGFSPR